MEKSSYETVDVTPTWESLIKLYLDLYEGSSAPEKKQGIAEEFKRMARLVDAYVALKKESN